MAPTTVLAASTPDAPTRSWLDSTRPAYRPAFPPAWSVDVAAGTLWDAAGGADGASLHVGTLAEGPRFFVTVGPGAVRFSRRNLVRQERAVERAHGAARKLVDQSAGVRAERALDAVEAVLAARLGGDAPAVTRLDPLDRRDPTTKVTEWTAKSRANMTWRLLTLDYSPLLGQALPALVTFTLPGDWTRLAPTGRRFKALVRSFGKRYRRAWGTELVGVWKLEFQRRGAPHLHVLMCPPLGKARCGRTWRDWFAETWADVAQADDVVPAGPRPAEGVRFDARYFVTERARMVAAHRHPDAAADYAEGLRATDPKRIAVYFLKHNTAGDKEYQHVVPAAWREPGAGPGRFWGVWGLKVSVSTVEVTYQQAVAAARVARKIAAAEQGTRRVRVWRTDTRTGEVRTRTVRRRVKRLRGTWGFLAVNDGPALALLLSTAVPSRDVTKLPDERDSLHAAVRETRRADDYWSRAVAAAETGS